MGLTPRTKRNFYKRKKSKVAYKPRIETQADHNDEIDILASYERAREANRLRGCC